MRTMGFDNPLVVIGAFTIVPHVIIRVVGIVNTVADAHVGRAAGKGHKNDKGGCDESGTQQ